MLHYRSGTHLHDVARAEIKRDESVSSTGGTFRVAISIIVTHNDHSISTVHLHSEEHDSFTEAAKELILDKPIFIEGQYNEKENRESVLEPEEAYEI